MALRKKVFCEKVRQSIFAGHSLALSHMCRSEGLRQNETKLKTL